MGAFIESLYVLNIFKLASERQNIIETGFKKNYHLIHMILK
jgi:hypothetical protein